MSFGTRPSAGEQTSSSEAPGRIPGEAGVWFLIFGDLVVFSVIFVVFIHARGADTSLFNASQATLHRTFGGLNTLILLTSSLLVALAINVFRLGRRRRAAQNLLCGAVLCAGAFLVNKGIEWTMLLMAGHGPSTNSYYMHFFVLTGLHAAHVVLGIVLLAVMIAFTRKDAPSENQYSFVESGACFWHLVDMLWLIIFPLLYLMH
jgi:nitric oxide reductase NorE protein